MIFSNPIFLYLLPLTLVPLVAGLVTTQEHPSLAGLPADKLSIWLDRALRISGACAIAGLLLGLAGAATPERAIENIGTGAHIALLIDRSSSMDETFAGRAPSGGEESKSKAAERLLKEFVVGRTHDNFGVGLFSTAPIPVMPITEHKDAVLAAINAIDRPALGFTDIGRGLAMALDTIAADQSPAEKAILIVSDGAALIERRIQEQLRTSFARQPLKLYWLYLRTEGSRGINDVPEAGAEDTPQALPERHLNKFFASLKIPYHAYEAESPEAVQKGISEISKLEQRPVTYVEHLPRHELSRVFYAVAAAAIGLLLVVNWMSVGSGKSNGTERTG